jgi:carboxysome shell carbonic anhydrase
VNEGLADRARAIDAAFEAIEPTLKALAPRQFEAGFPALAVEILRERLGVEVPPAALAASWIAPLDMRALQARCVLGAFEGLVRRTFDRSLSRLSEGESAEDLIRRWGFHAMDISPCADGRLSGVVDYILRVPPALVVSRRSHAGAMFEIEDSLRQWEAVELRRSASRESAQTTRYLKIGVYHFSGSDPLREGCAAHGSDEARAARALLERLEAFEIAVRNLHGREAGVAILLVGVDTDTDAIRVHIPDAGGAMRLDRFLDNRDLYESTAHLSREGAKAAIRTAVAAAAGVAEDDATSEGMRWFCGYLLKNNLAQVEAVKTRHGAGYADLGHTERLIVVGDPIDDVQLRNLAFQAQMATVEDGAVDLDVGIGILRRRLEPCGLAIPVLAHVRFDPRIPGSQGRAGERARRLRRAIVERRRDLASCGALYVGAAIRAAEDPLIMLETGDAP